MNPIFQLLKSVTDTHNSGIWLEVLGHRPSHQKNHCLRHTGHPQPGDGDDGGGEGPAALGCQDGGGVAHQVAVAPRGDQRHAALRGGGGCRAGWLPDCTLSPLRWNSPPPPRRNSFKPRSSTVQAFRATQLGNPSMLPKIWVWSPNQSLSCPVMMWSRFGEMHMNTPSHPPHCHQASF